jgi:3'-phosphoadenosine 5'-phosphosulfate sulfotransferase (PAPS reductase)/FAD synthetase
MKEYLSFGAGVGSTALMLHLLSQGKRFETLFVDHETDLPETYEYVAYLQERGYQVNVIKPNYEGFSSLYEYCKFRKFLPSIYLRWCTYRFKLQPLWKSVEKPCIMNIGISFDEKHRAIPKYKQKQAKGIKIKYPLIENVITRRDCVKIIQDHGLKVPLKSGCWICPYQSPRTLIWLYSNHRELFNKIVELEEIRGNKHSLKPKPAHYYVPWKTEPLENYMNLNQRRLDEHIQKKAEP